MRLLSLFSPILLLLLSSSNAQVTIYHQAQYTLEQNANVTLGAHNSQRLVAPALPNPMPGLGFNIQLLSGGMPGMSIPIPSAFMGFSVEMSVANQVLGHNSTLLEPSFLNLMHNIVQRCGAVHVRVGGNTQDYASVVPAGSLENGRILVKDKTNFIENNPTATPPTQISVDLFTMMRAISEFTNVRWFLGIPFNDTNFRMGIVDESESILGDFLVGLQAANEPDFYEAHGHRPTGWGMQGYMQDLDILKNVMADEKYAKARTQWIVPSITNHNDWSNQQLWDMGLATQFSDNIKYLAAERYPHDNCAALFPSPDNPITDPQSLFAEYLDHNSPAKLAGQYAPDTLYAQSVGKPFWMFETNTASCGGFPGISDSFGASLWALDYGLQLAANNFSGAMFHVGGQTTFYNPFSAAPTNETQFRQWTVGSVYYSALVLAEAMGTSNTSQVIDLLPNNGASVTPGYAIFENGGQPSKLALFNYMDDGGTGSAAYTASFSIGGGATGQPNGNPTSVKVKYLLSPSVSDKGNFTWAGQTFGDQYGSDGRLRGDLDIQTVQCNPADNTCSIRVPAPGFALVFINSDPNDQLARPSQTFSTSAVTQTRNTAKVAAEVLATSNGHKNAGDDKDHSTSYGSGNRNGALGGFGPSIWMGTVTGLFMGVYVGLRRA